MTTRGSRPGARSLRAACALPLATALVTATLPGLADMTKAQCAEANTNGQDLRRDGKLAAARAELVRCGEASCPGIVRDDCNRRLDELDKAQPTIAFEVKDAAGADVSAVRVTVDGKPWAESLEGKALRVDPGKHSFVFFIAGHDPTTRSLVITEGEKGRRERVVPEGPGPALKGSTATPSPEPTTAAPGEATTGGGLGTQRVLGLVSLGLGAVGVGLGSVFGSMTLSEWSKAKTACGGDVTRCTDAQGAATDRSSALSDATISTASFIAGGVFVAAGAALFLTASPRPSAPATGIVVLPDVGPHEAGLAIKGAF